MFSQLEVRAAQDSDAESVFALLQQFAASYGPDPVAFTSNFSVLIVAEGCDVLVACVERSVVGYILAHRWITLFANGPIAEVVELMVDPAHRGNGIGKQLVSEVIDRARGAGCVEITVPTRRACGFYESLGFVETASYFKRRL